MVARRPPTADQFALGLAILAGLLLFAVFRGHGFDDSYITYRYAANLAAGLGLVYNPGERVLSTTAPLLAIALAPLRAAGLDLPTAGNALSCLGYALGALAIYRLGRLWEAPLAGAVGGALYLFFPLFYATIGGEAGPYQALLLWGFVAVAAGRPHSAGLLLGLATVLRADAALAAVCAGLCFVAQAWRGLPAAARSPRALLAALPWGYALVYLALVGAWFLACWAYFGQPLPVTFAVKQRQALIVETRLFAPGLLDYLAGFWSQWLLRPLFALAPLGLIAALRRPGWLLPIGWGLLHGLAYSLLGVPAYGWYFIPSVTALVVAAGLGADTLRRLLPPRIGPPTAILLAALILAGELAGLAYVQLHPDPRLGPYRAAGEWLRANAAPGEVAAALEVGIIGYRSGLPMVDFAGLIQPEVSAIFSPTADYAAAARYAAARYRPNLIVLQETILPITALRDDSADHCVLVAAVPGAALPNPLHIYRCRW